MRDLWPIGHKNHPHLPPLEQLESQSLTRAIGNLPGVLGRKTGSVWSEVASDAAWISYSAARLPGSRVRPRLRRHRSACGGAKASSHRTEQRSSPSLLFSLGVQGARAREGTERAGRSGSAPVSGSGRELRAPLVLLSPPPAWCPGLGQIVGSHLPRGDSFASSGGRRLGY